jgi:B12 binding protein
MVADRALYQAILDGDAKLARSLAEEAVSKGANPQSLVDEQMIPAMDEVGRLFECHEYFVPEMLIAARAMRAALEVVQSRLTLAETESKGKVVIGTVKGYQGHRGTPSRCSCHVGSAEHHHAGDEECHRSSRERRSSRAGESARGWCSGDGGICQADWC